MSSRAVDCDVDRRWLGMSGGTGRGAVFVAYFRPGNRLYLGISLTEPSIMVTKYRGPGGAACPLDKRK